ncbi:Crp/Fnr family transcriptional regulator [Flavobacterium sp. PLA-1-15]|uniref:Crp/Fnr family transcriptional regulator n=1 Tax=Flavobacterium sp. PLA-1-15 TaxID=3380533 RepID=UPI003B80D61C
MNIFKDLYTATLSLKRNDYLKVAGSVDTNIYFIESGSLRIYILDEDEEQIIRFGYSDNIIVALDSFFTEKPSDFYIQAIKKTVVNVIPKNVFYGFIEKSASHKSLLIPLLEDLILQQMEREKDILTASPKERFNRVMRRSPRLFQEIPDKYIANYLRMSPETLSRLKKS